MTDSQIPHSLDARRPLKVRGSSIIKKFSQWLSHKNITPNHISIVSVIFAMLAAACLISLPDGSHTGLSTWVLPVLAALFIQCRLLCNLFDGMVAVEGGKGTASGELFNDIPDRIADPIILIAAGFSISHFAWGETLGWCAGLLAVMTAYVRTLATSIGAPVNFQGPMAKQHRMAVMTIACLAAAVEQLFWPLGTSFVIAHSLIVIGCIITVILRSRKAYVFLEQQSGE